MCQNTCADSVRDYVINLRYFLFSRLAEKAKLLPDDACRMLIL